MDISLSLVLQALTVKQHRKPIYRTYFPAFGTPDLVTQPNGADLEIPPVQVAAAVAAAPAQVAAAAAAAAAMAAVMVEPYPEATLKGALETWRSLSIGALSSEYHLRKLEGNRVEQAREEQTRVARLTARATLSSHFFVSW